MDRETASDRRGKTADIDTQTNEDKHQEEQTQNDRNMSRRETDPERWRLGRETGKQRHSEPTKAEWEGGRQQALQIVLLEANLTSRLFWGPEQVVGRERDPRDEAHLQELLIKGAVSLHSLTGLLGLGGQGLRPLPLVP